MPNAQTKAASNTGQKKERKAPVRKGPQAKDYPSRVAYLEAVLQYERDEQAKADQAKIARLDKRIQAKTKAIGEMRDELDKLTRQRAELAGFHDEDETPES